MRLFSYRKRPVHLGPYPLERLQRQRSLPDLAAIAPMTALSFDDANPESLSHAMARYIAMFDLVRDGAVNATPGDVPAETLERTRHLKAAGYYFDASMMGCCTLPREAVLAAPIRNAQVAALGAELEASHPKSFAAGMDMILADVLESARSVHAPVAADDAAHRHVLVIAVEYPRDPRPGEPGCDWIAGTQAQRAAVLAAQTAVLLSTYLRMLGHAARAHSATCSEVDLPRLAVACGLADGSGANPYLGRRFGLAAVTTAFELAADLPLAPRAQQRRWRSHGAAWWLGGSGPGQGTSKTAFNREAYARREFRDGALPFETLQRRDTPTTFIDHARVPRFPKRADFFARALFGDLGKTVQDSAKNAHYVMKSPIGACARRALGALLLLQFGDARGAVSPSTHDARRNARQPEGRVVLPGRGCGRAVRGARMGLLLARCRRPAAGGLPRQRRQPAARPGPRDDGGCQRRRLDLGGTEHARLPALFAARRHRRRADPPPRLQRARALGAGRRRAAAAAAAAVGAGRGQPHRRGDPQPLSRPTAEERQRHHRHADVGTTSRSISGCRRFCKTATNARANARRAPSPPARS